MSDERSMVFAAGKNEDGRTVLVIGIGDACWNAIKNGATSHLDLLGAGIDLQLVVFGHRNHASIRELLRQSGAVDGDTRDVSDQYFGITPPGKAH